MLKKRKKKSNTVHSPAQALIQKSDDYISLKIKRPHPEISNTNYFSPFHASSLEIVVIH